jgi:hypothetical protein
MRHRKSSAQLQTLSQSYIIGIQTKVGLPKQSLSTPRRVNRSCWVLCLWWLHLAWWLVWRVLHECCCLEGLPRLHWQLRRGICKFYLSRDSSQLICQLRIVRAVLCKSLLETSFLNWYHRHRRIVCSLRFLIRRCLKGLWAVSLFGFLMRSLPLEPQDDQAI